MRILGLHVGHDAGVAIIEDGKVLFLAHNERLLRQKKSGGLSYPTVISALKRSGLSINDIDFCAISSTQGVNIILDGRLPLSLTYTRHNGDSLTSNLAALVRSGTMGELRAVLSPSTLQAGEAERADRRYEKILEQMDLPPAHALFLPGHNRGLIQTDSPIAAKSVLQKLDCHFPASVDVARAHKFDFNFPATLLLEGRAIPTALIGHHAAHAAATFYQSSFHAAPIMTLDGGSGRHEGGLFWFGSGNEIVPLRVHYLDLGRIYLAVAHTLLKLGGSAEGKMMGLAPYGKPAFFDERFVANAIGENGFWNLAGEWMAHLNAKIAQSPDYQVQDLADPDKMTAPVNADIAASTQMLFEETMLAAVGQLGGLLDNMGIQTDQLALSGGCMLNCPTNTRISQETRFKTVHVEPACDDGGLPVGAALWVYHNLMGYPRTPTEPLKQGVPYLGLPVASADVKAALEEFADRIVVARPASYTAEGARRLADGQVIGWFEGRSEIGPRALGHRSIVADPRSDKAWHRVNTIKGRELWRPLAPSVLAEHAKEWFSGMPESSPFMMFTGTVTRPDIPAITHIDGTARVQTVTADCGGYYDLIKAFHQLTGCAVVLNTSMNGPGQPIAEYPEDAIEMLLDGRFDVLFLEGALIQRRAV